MSRSPLRLSRPVYESLPWVYMACGAGALVASYLLRGSGPLSPIVGVLGLAALIGGIVVLLRRRDFRALRAAYGDPAGLSSGDRED